MKNNLVLKKSIYRLSDIEDAMDAYVDICAFGFSEVEDAYVLEVLSKGATIELIKKEFENYLIGLSGRNVY